MPVIQASKDGDLERLKKILEEGADVNAVDALHQSTALHWAAYNGRLDIVQYLCLHHHDLLYKVDNNGRTALHDAANKGHL